MPSQMFKSNGMHNFECGFSDVELSFIGLFTKWLYQLTHTQMDNFTIFLSISFVSSKLDNNHSWGLIKRIIMVVKKICFELCK